MQTIGYYYLIDRGAFNVNPEVMYTNANGQSGTTGSYGERMAGQSIKFSPGSNPDVQNGAIVRLKVSVVLGRDRTASESFVFESDSDAIANYAISKTTLNSDLKFLGITNGSDESEKLAAEYVDDEGEMADNS